MMIMHCMDPYHVRVELIGGKSMIVLYFVIIHPCYDTFDDIDENHPTRHMRDGNEGIWIDNSSLPGHVNSENEGNEWNAS